MSNTNIHAEWWNSDALLGRDGNIRTIFAPAAFAREYYGEFEHYAPSRLTSTTTYPGWTVTPINLVGEGTLVMADRVEGWLQLVGSAAVGEGIQMQSDGLSFIPAANLDIFFEAEIELLDADDIEWMIGLADTDADVQTGDPTELIVFRGNDGDLNLDFQVRDGGVGATADTGTDMGDTTSIRLGFWVRGATSVIPVINGVAQAAVMANIPTALLSVTFSMLNGATQANNTLSINWYRIVQLLT